MVDLDFSMEGVKPLGEAQELPVGQYIVRIGETKKVKAKDKFDTNNVPEPGNAINHFLEVPLQVEGGPNHEQIEMVRLNLWNINDLAVKIAKSEWKSIQDATQLYAPSSDAYHGKYLMLIVKLGRNNKLQRHYEPVPPSILATLPVAPVYSTSAPQQGTYAPQGGYSPPSQHHTAPPQPAQHYGNIAPAPQQPITHNAAAQSHVPTQSAAMPANPSELPDWAARPAGR